MLQRVALFRWNNFHRSTLLIKNFPKLVDRLNFRSVNYEHWQLLPNNLRIQFLSEQVMPEARYYVDD